MYKSASRFHNRTGRSCYAKPREIFTTTEIVECIKNAVDKKMCFDDFWRAVNALEIKPKKSGVTKNGKKYNMWSFEDRLNIVKYLATNKEGY